MIIIFYYIVQGLFAAANIFSSLKLVYIFSVNPYLGPLQVSLSRMVIDIMKFTFLYLLVLFAFSCGMNQLLWYYADLEKQACMEDLKAHSNNQTTMHAVSGRKSNKVVVSVVELHLTRLSVIADGVRER